MPFIVAWLIENLGEMPPRAHRREEVILAHRIKIPMDRHRVSHFVQDAIESMDGAVQECEFVAKVLSRDAASCAEEQPRVAKTVTLATPLYVAQIG